MGGTGIYSKMARECTADKRKTVGAKREHAN